MLAAFAPQVRDGRVDVAAVAFDKYQVNDVREALYAQGRKRLRTDLGLSAHQLNCLPTFVLNEALDRLIVKQLTGRATGAPFAWPSHTKSGPSRVVDLKTDRAGLTTERCARLMRLATLRSVDRYFHKIRSTVRPASRPVSTPSGNGRTWDRHFLYKPEILVKIMEIYRFHHTWMGPRQTKRTPAMNLGLAKGRIYERDPFAERSKKRAANGDAHSTTDLVRG